MDNKQASKLALAMAKKRYASQMPLSDGLSQSDGVERAEEVFRKIRRATSRKKISKQLEDV